MLPVQMSRRALTLALLASPLLAVKAQLAAAQQASPTPEIDSYISEQFGYHIVWPEDWTLITTDSEEDGFDMVQLTRDDATAYIVISRPGDTPLSEIVELMAAGPNEETFVPGMTATDEAGNEIIGETADRAWGAWNGNLAGEIVDGFTQFRYGEVRRLEENLGVGLSLAMPATSFDKDIALYSALLDGVSKVGGTPVADEQT